MAFTFGFYNSVNHDRRYDAVQVGQIFDGIIKDGVYETYKKAMLVKASNYDNQVIVQPGRAWFNHTWSYNDADLPVSIPDPETFNQRIDAVVLDINSANSARVNSIQVVRGTPAPNYPARPTLTNTLEHHQYPLCYITRYGGVSTIYQRDITNTVGTSECPFVIGVLEGLSVDEFLAQWTDEYNEWLRVKKVTLDQWMADNKKILKQWMTDSDRELNVWMTTHERLFLDWMNAQEQAFFEWMENEKTSYAAFLEHNEIAWRNWFDHVQTELDGDVAGHLQQQIDAISWIYFIDGVVYLPNTGASFHDGKVVLLNHN